LPAVLLRFLRSLSGRPGGGAQPQLHEYPEERLARLKRAHERAPVDRHLDIIYSTLRVGGQPLNEFMHRCLADSRVESPPLKAFHRPLASFFLAQYFLHALDIEGERAECGVFFGTSALLLCRAAGAKIPGYTGSGLHLIDSFAGLSEPSPADGYSIRGRGANEAGRATRPKGWLAAPIDEARATLKDYPGVSFHPGWIPQVLSALPEARWSFVHLDLDLYEPTLGSLEYFYPRLAAGGVIICDDYGAPLFPGAHRAWDQFCDDNGIAYVVLDTGQSVILKT
jgi:hypothetical protein